MANVGKICIQIKYHFINKFIRSIFERMDGYKVKVGEEKEYFVKGIQEGEFEIDGKNVAIDIKPIGKDKFHIIHNYKSYSVELLNKDTTKKELSIKVNNNNYDLAIEDKFDLLLQKLGMDIIGTAAVTDLLAPMPGLVLNTEVKAGDEVKKDEPLIVLEAMKMENVLKSPIDGIIKEVSVNNGETVEKNQVLIVFES